MSSIYLIGVDCGSLFEDFENFLDEYIPDWEELDYGFCSPSNFQSLNEELIFDIDAEDIDEIAEETADGEITISSNHPNFNILIYRILNEEILRYFDSEKIVIDQDKFKELVKNDCKVTITEVDTGDSYFRGVF